ncbi:MAG: putative Flp pilus assembly protein CpaB [Cereibacter sp.]|nr:putative Flp pilus assembly protein CpaB [Cereibacter sp.]
MRLVFGLVLLVGLALAGTAVYMAQGFIATTQAELEQERAVRAQLGPTAAVYVVNKRLNYGDPLTKADVQKIYWPANALPETIFQDEALLFPEGETRPRYMNRQIEAFEPLLASRVTEPGVQVGLVVSKGMRAFAISVNAQTGVSGFLQPGSYVDVIWTGTAEGGGMTRQIENKLRVIAVDQTANDASAGQAIVARTVTVEVTPQQVAILAQAQSSGQLSLSMVGHQDEPDADVTPVDTADITGVVAAAPAPQVQQAKSCSVRMRKGQDVVEIPIACTN